MCAPSSCPPPTSLRSPSQRHPIPATGSGSIQSFPAAPARAAIAGVLLGLTPVAATRVEVLPDIDSGSLRCPRTRTEGYTMASATEHTPTGTNGGSATATIPVENPATGELITTIPILAPDEIAQLAARARA